MRWWPRAITPPIPPAELSGGITAEDAFSDLEGVGPVELGERAATLLRDPLLQKAFRHVRDDLLRHWAATKTDEVEERERTYCMLRGLDSIEARLKSYINNAKVVADRRRQDAA